MAPMRAATAPASAPRGEFPTPFDDRPDWLSIATNLSGNGGYVGHT